MTGLVRLNVKVTLQGHVIYHSVCVHSISPEPNGRFFFIKLHLNVPYSEACEEPTTQLLKSNVTLQDHGFYPPSNLLNQLLDFQ